LEQYNQQHVYNLKHTLLTIS